MSKWMLRLVLVGLVGVSVVAGFGQEKPQPPRPSNGLSPTPPMG